MEDSKVLVTKKVSAIAPWADRADVRELAERLQAMMPGGSRLTQVEALTLAQAAVAHGLDPLNGELWYLKDKQGRPLGLMAGIKGHRRAAHRQVQEEGGGNYWPDFEGPLALDEKMALGIPKGALAFRCKIRDTRTINEYIGEIERLMAAGLPWEAVESIVGARPYTAGVGYAEPTERSKMTLVQRAMKRAEADALKRRFDLPFGVAVGMGGDNNGVYIDAEFVVEEEPEAESPEETLQRNQELLHGDDDDLDLTAASRPKPKAAPKEPTTNGDDGNGRIWPAQVVLALIETGLTSYQAVRRLNLSNLDPGDAEDVILNWALVYDEARLTAESKEAADIANAWWAGEMGAEETGE